MHSVWWHFITNSPERPNFSHFEQPEDEPGSPESKLEQEINLNEQYESQRDLLSSFGITERLSNGEEGIIAIDGKEYPIPSYEEIQKRIEKQERVYTQKAKQGFTKLLLVPLGMPLGSLIDKYRDALIQYHNEGKLTEEINLNNPISVEDEYQDADINNSLVYYPKQFTRNDHGGLTKEELIRA